MEQPDVFTEESTDPSFSAKQKIQIELMRSAGGESDALSWIEANARRLQQILENKEDNFIERFNDPETHAEVIEQIKRKLYH